VDKKQWRVQLYLNVLQRSSVQAVAAVRRISTEGKTRNGAIRLHTLETKRTRKPEGRKILISADSKRLIDLCAVSTCLAGKKRYDTRSIVADEDGNAVMSSADMKAKSRASLAITLQQVNFTHVAR
jgi:hypothetical protein